ncbi:acetyl-CoA acetyltransferase [Corynebacterium sphenisci DSM 44792]|uniref:Acetyl-CoA acetyltransferase n=1 Tax=Corynebacterium sphenisci DSM 44792 TaxID=1437874 RepID=A0A1L7D029_9CORY|nr:acetyl-CoA acetyltransferase [Corynebacterium sphenisci]APT91403.1 acetyl-CoA acetyltransferase [Corynebacterium sphenisci DSM 44792]
MFSTRTRKSTSTSMTFGAGAPARTRAADRDQPAATRTFTEDPFRARFGHRLPRGLRQEARGMDWRTFTATYSPTGGPLEIREFTAVKGLAGRSTFSATITTGRGLGGDHGTRTRRAEVTAMGPVSAVTNLMADAGYRVEILEFHQFEIFEATATFIYAAHNNSRVWTMGFGQTPEASTMTAMTCAANRLHG